VAKGRRVRRVVRSIDTWTVLKLSLVFYLSILVVVLIAGTVLWFAAEQAGLLGNIQNFIKDLGDFKSFKFDGLVILEICGLTGLVLVLVGTVVNLILAVLYNLIADLVGGIQVTILEEQLDPTPVLSLPTPAETTAEDRAATAMTPSPFAG
jgi:hypothetical protein